VTYDRRHLLFVYGTLKSGEEAHFKMAGATSLGKCFTSPKYSILEKPDFLGLVNGGTAVEGELYAVDPEKLLELDDWEDQIFRRSAIVLDDGRVVDCYKLQDGLIRDVARLTRQQHP
jgi:gamma-glutamylcyclotransferase (GGCT)/AIG2-like uncharacterized protein YtfP